MLKRGLRAFFFTTILFVVSTQTSEAQWEVRTLVAAGAGLDDGMVVDREGNLYVSQYQGTVVRRMTPDGVVSVYGTGFAAPNGLALDLDDNLYVANAFGGRVSRIAPDGTITQSFITGVENPSGLAFDASYDTLYVSHYGTSQISKVAVADPGNVVSWLSGSPLDGPIGLAFDPGGNLYAGNYNNGRVFRITPDGVLTELANLQSLLGFLTYSNGYLYATSYSTNRIFRINVDGTSTDVIAGSGIVGGTDGFGTSATFDGPNGITATAFGDSLYVSEFNTGALRMLSVTSPINVEEHDVPDERSVIVETFPNPFHSSTTISYTKTDVGPITISIYDMLGREVRSLSSDEGRPGKGSIIWDGRNGAGENVGAGAYICVVASGESVQSTMLIRM